MYEERPSALPGVVVWTAVAGGHQRVLPDGCMDLLWLGDRAVVAGPDTHAFLSEVPAGTACTGLRFAPGSLPPVLGVPASAVCDQRVPLEDLWRPSEAERLAADVAAGTDPAVALETAVRRRGPTIEPDPLVGAVVRHLAAGTPVAAVADVIGVSDRHLRRRSLASFGYGPKVLARVLRLCRALDLARAGVPWAMVAARSGYADQPHLAREVRALTGTRPGDLAG